MRYCPNCGKEVPSEVNFCPFCGKRLVVAPSTYPMKNEGLAAVLAGLIGLLIFGVGHFYVGKIARGIALLMIGGILYLSYILSGGITPYYFSVEAAVLAIMWVILWAWSIYDAYHKAKQYNEQLRTHGKPPW